MKGRATPYSEAELAWLSENRTLPIADYGRQFRERFGRDVSNDNLHALRVRRGWRTGRDGRFRPGAEPVNKGQACAPGQGGRHPNAVRTQFKPGSRAGRADMNWKPIGTERITREGYRERKIHDGLPMQSRWRAVHLIEWEARHGPIPPGHCLKRLGPDKLDTRPENWTLIPRALLPRLNGGTRKKHLAFDDAAPETRQAILAIARLEHAAKTRKRKREEQA